MSLFKLNSDTHVRHTFLSWKHELEAGNITPLEALYRWTMVAVKEPVIKLKPYAELVREWLPQVEWLKEGEHVIWGSGYVDWTCPADFYKWADQYLGHVFTVGEFLRDYIAEHDPAKRDSMVKGKQKEIMERAEKAKELKAQGMTQQQIADKLGCSRETISKDLVKKKCSNAKKLPNPSAKLLSTPLANTPSPKPPPSRSLLPLAMILPMR